MAFPEDRDRELQRLAHETLQFADELIDWLGRFNPQRLAAHQAPVPADEEFNLLTLRRTAAGLFRSSLVPAAAAIYGPSQVGKSLFVGRILQPKDERISPLGPDEGRGPPVYYPGLSFDRDINPRCGSHEATAIVTRFTTKDRFDSDVHPDYPVLVRGLSRSEWMRVLARGFRSECSLDRELSFRESELEALFEDVAARLGAREVDRDWRMDLVDTYNYLRRLDPLRYHADVSFMNGLLSRYPLTQTGYVEVAARLGWGNRPQLTELFTRIDQFLQKIGRNGRRGLLAHWAALRFLLDSQQRAEHVNADSTDFPKVQWNDIVSREVDGWYVLDYAPGQGPPADPLATIQSAMLEMVIPVLPHRLNDIWRKVLEQIDVLDIPGMIAGGQGEEGAVSGAAPNAETQATIVKRGKVFYLFERYIDELQAQTLLLLIRGGSLNVRGYLKEYVDKWGRARYGKDVWPRRVSDALPALFLGMTGIDEEILNEPPTAALYDARLKLLVNDTFQELMNDFGGPGKPFTNVYPLRYPGTWDWDTERRDKALAGGLVSSDHWTEGGRAFAASTWVQKYVADAARKWETAMRDGDGGASLIADGFRQVTSSERKQEELSESQTAAQDALERLGRRWVVDPDVNADRRRRESVAREVLEWLNERPDVTHVRIQALADTLCFRGGDVVPIADMAETGSPGSESSQSIEGRFPEALKSFLRDWGTTSAPERWADYTADRVDAGRWLTADRFANLTRYLADYLTSPNVFGGLCDALLEIVQLKIASKVDRRQARRRCVQLILNDHVVNLGDRPVEGAAGRTGRAQSPFGLLEPLIRRWEVRLPQALAAGAGDEVYVPAGNAELIEMMKRYEG